MALVKGTVYWSLSLCALCDICLLVHGSTERLLAQRCPDDEDEPGKRRDCWVQLCVNVVGIEPVIFQMDRDVMTIGQKKTRRDYSVFKFPFSLSNSFVFNKMYFY